MLARLPLAVDAPEPARQALRVSDFVASLASAATLDLRARPALPPDAPPEERALATALDGVLKTVATL